MKLNKRMKRQMIAVVVLLVAHLICRHLLENKNIIFNPNYGLIIWITVLSIPIIVSILMVLAHDCLKPKVKGIMSIYLAPIIFFGSSLILFLLSRIGIYEVEKMNFLIDSYFIMLVLSILMVGVGFMGVIGVTLREIVRKIVEKTKK
ncbi:MULTISPECIES: hypothetical protein [Vagococcus]|uniref:hypothetical protein n=1 Tax=Vagococcus TaxID=2737 RepID=UPI000B35F314|nr:MULTISPECIES: hypothetical protein [Vagococcus]HCM88574.1 hypothetical protein [Vagococcus sp.]